MLYIQMGTRVVCIASTGDDVRAPNCSVSADSMSC